MSSGDGELEALFLWFEIMESRLQIGCVKRIQALNLSGCLF